MKKRLLYTEITKAAEELATALRKFAGVPMYANVSIVTRDRIQDEAEEPDVYTLRVHEANGEPVGDMILAESGLIYRDREGKITKVDRIISGGVKDD